MPIVHPPEYQCPSFHCSCLLCLFFFRLLSFLPFPLFPLPRHDWTFALFPYFALYAVKILISVGQILMSCSICLYTMWWNCPFGIPAHYVFLPNSLSSFLSLSLSLSLSLYLSLSIMSLSFSVYMSVCLFLSISLCLSVSLSLSLFLFLSQYFRSWFVYFILYQCHVCGRQGDTLTKQSKLLFAPAVQIIIRPDQTTNNILYFRCCISQATSRLAVSGSNYLRG